MEIMHAHREWKSRPMDQRFPTVEALQDAVDARRALSREVKLDSKAVRVVATDDGGMQVQGSGARLTHWSFGQAAALGSAPAGFLRELPAPMAAQVLNHRLEHADRASVNVFVGADPAQPADVSVRAFNSDRYGRIFDADVIRMVRHVTDGTSWRPPLGYEGGRWGAPMVPSGLYASDRDCFVFMVDEERPVEVRGEALNRGFIMRNSEVGAATFNFMAFLYRRVCGNNIIWGGELLGEVNVRHVGNAMRRASFIVGPALREYVNADTSAERGMIARALDFSVGANEREAGEFLRNKGFSKPDAAGAVAAAVKEEGGAGSLWQVVQGLTALARQKEHTDERVSLERAAGKLLDLAA